ncbi:hypothetical protein BDA96_10G166100 [Sorghum bicolor]|uniref:Uncharacterized protein n=1 Tax=Sorghum bicolor TaxID=4558 RepID=A0A921Q2K1_SORBI|nr:hypothetical protein BDA96_10G166100 [Sorghum bicolor]
MRAQDLEKFMSRHTMMLNFMKMVPMKITLMSMNMCLCVGPTQQHQSSSLTCPTALHLCSPTHFLQPHLCSALTLTPFIQPQLFSPLSLAPFLLSQLFSALSLALMVQAHQGMVMEITPHMLTL